MNPVLEDFVAELAAVDGPAADGVVRALAAVDLEADGSRDAVAFMDCLTAAVRAGGSLEARLRRMREFCDFKGTVRIPRALLYP